MARRIRWQILIAAISSLLVFGLMAYLALTTTAVARPLAGGVYIEGLPTPPRQLNPLVSDPASDPSGADIQALVFEGLTRIGVDGLPEPGLASWQIDETGRVYTFTLRTDLTWHDGRALTADDVLFSLRAVQNPGFAGDRAIREAWRNVLVDRVNDRTVRCVLNASAAPLLSLATFPILPAHLLGDLPPEEWATSPFSQAPVGAGPYRLRELTSAHALLEANPSYYAGRPFLDTIELRFFDSPQQAQAALTRGEINGLSFLGTSELARANPPRDGGRVMALLDSYTTLTFNLRNDLLADLALRRALALALDKEALIEQAVSGQVERLDTPLLHGWWANDPAVSTPPADPARAGEALTALGFVPGPNDLRARDGQPLDLPLLTSDDPERVAQAQEIARQWGALGVRVEVEAVDATTFQQRLADRDFTLALHGWQRLGADPDVVFEQWHSRNADRGFNYAGLSDSQIDTLLTNARAASSLTERLASYRAFQRRWVELTPSITLYQQRLLYDVPLALGGIGMLPPGDSTALPLLAGAEERFRTVARWFVRSEREIRGDLRESP